MTTNIIGLYFSGLTPNPIPPTPRRMKAKSPMQQLEAIKAVNIEPKDVKTPLITQAPHLNKVNQNVSKRII